MSIDLVGKFMYILYTIFEISGSLTNRLFPHKGKRIQLILNTRDVTSGGLLGSQALTLRLVDNGNTTGF